MFLDVPGIGRAKGFLTLIFLSIAGCGGGGGGGSSPSVTANVQSVSVQAKVTDAAVAFSPILLTAMNVPSSGLYVSGGTTTSGVASLSPGRFSATQAEVDVYFKNPYTLAPKTYTDTVELKVCTDQACASQIAGSPITVGVTYVVAAVSGTSAPTVALSLTAIKAQALPTDVSTPAAPSIGMTIQNAPSFPITFTLTSSSNGIASAAFGLPMPSGVGSSGQNNNVAVTYRAPSTLAAGVYQDTITITACLDPACVNPLVGSPQTIQVTYQIGNNLPGPNGYTVTTVALQANDMVWDPVHSRLYASVSASSASSPSTIAVIDPTTATVTGTVTLGAEVGRLAISDDGQYLYAALKGAATIRRLLLPALSSDITINIGIAPQGNALETWDLQVAPGSPRTLAVARTIPVNEPQSMGIVVFDDATARPTIAGINAQGATNELAYLQWGATTSAMYSEGQSMIDTLSVNSSGATVTSSVTDGPDGKVHFYNNLLFMDAGTVFDTGLGQVVGQLPSTGEVDRTVIVDGGLSRIFRLSENGGTYSYLTIYDLKSYAVLKSFTVIGHTLGFWTPAFVRWGPNGLAYVSQDGSIVIVAGPYLTS